MANRVISDCSGCMYSNLVTEKYNKSMLRFSLYRNFKVSSTITEVF